MFPGFEVPNADNPVELFPVLLDELDGAVVAKSPLPEAFCLLASGLGGGPATRLLTKPGFEGVVSFPCEVLTGKDIVVWFSLGDGVGDRDPVEDGVNPERMDDGGFRFADVSG